MRAPSRSRRQPATASPTLLATIGDRLRAQGAIIECFVPYDRADVLAALHRSGEVLVEVHDDVGTRVGRASRQAVAAFRRVHAMTLV